MTRDTLIEKVRFITNPESHREMQMYAFKKGDNTPYKINVDPVLINEIIPVMSYGVQTLLIGKEYSIVSYSTADERKNRYYEYDLVGIPANMKAMSDVIGNAHYANYDFDFEELDHLVMVFSDGGGHVFSIYKAFSSVEKLTKSTKSIFGIMRADILSSFEGKLLRIGPNFQVIFVSDKYILLDDKFAESTFDIHAILNNQAKSCMNNLKSKNLVLDLKKLDKYKENISFSRKLVKVLSSSKILNGNIPKEDVLNFIENDEKLREILVIKEKEGEKFIEISNKTNAKTFLELLNDEFVYSQLTKQKYQAPDKDER